MRLNDIEMLTASGRATAQQVRHVLDEIYKELESSAATRLLTAIRRLPYADCSVCCWHLFTLRVATSIYLWLAKAIRGSAATYEICGSRRRRALRGFPTCSERSEAWQGPEPY